MRIAEVASPSNEMQLAALAQFLLGRAEDADTNKTISADAFIKIARDMGISVTHQQLIAMSQKPPLSNLISNVEPNEVSFRGAEPEVDDSDMSVDQARATVDKMAKRAAKV
jgi:hypothetical protein